jgi:hypothetical protein
MIYLKYDALDTLVAIMGYALQHGLRAEARLSEYGRWEIQLS